MTPVCSGLVHAGHDPWWMRTVEVAPLKEFFMGSLFPKPLLEQQHSVQQALQALRVCDLQ